WTVAAQARGIDVAKAEFYPDIDLLASIGGYAAMGPLFQFLKNPSHSWSAGPALSLPIFDGGRLRSQLGAASAGYDEAVERYNQSIVGALKDISDQVIRMRSLATQAQDADRSVAAARKNYELSREGYRRGLTDYLNVLIAQNQLLRAQEGVARIQAERLGVHASLVTALGGGLDDPANGPQANQTLPGHGKGKTAVQPSNAPGAKAAVAPAAIGTRGTIGTTGERNADPAAETTPKRAAATRHADTGNTASAQTTSANRTDHSDSTHTAPASHPGTGNTASAQAGAAARQSQSAATASEHARAVNIGAPAAE
ncbi:TolC family protein, partial [Paraburkholderia kirstenboschensis]